MAFTAGTKLGPYEILELIGAGGMGEVYKANDTRLDRIVAIKVSKTEFSERFGLEARAISALNHTYICQLYDVGPDYLVMEYVEGAPLKGPLPVEKVLEYATQIATALDAAHRKNITHRDLKPSNILVTSQGVKLLDFGLAKIGKSAAADQETVTMGPTVQGQVLGTLQYMSPEQARGETTDARSDLWSLGVILYEILAGKRPFEGRSQTDILAAIVKSDPPSLRSANRGVPPVLAELVAGLLVKDRDKRLSSAAEVAKKLQQISGAAAGSETRTRQRLWIAGAAIVVVSLSAWFGVREYRARWARDVAIPQVERFIAEDNYLAALDLAREAEKRIPEDARLAALWPQMSQKLSFETNPPGAEVFFKKYAAPEAPWRDIGTTPTANVTVPLGFFEWKITKEGYEDLHVAARTPAERLLPPFLPTNPIQRIALDRKGSVPMGMVKVPGGTLRISISAFGTVGPFSVNDYFIDRYEITNREFKQFVDRGGYRSPEYWKEPFRKGNQTLSWEQAINEFRDSTGQTGPATWELGTYLQGQEDFPVSGVSWYEAAAYAEFVQKKLPTVAHWYQAAQVGGRPYIVPASNFNTKGPARVGQYGGISGAGAYDMAGNVREWASNESDDGERFAMGGAWNDPAYQFSDPGARPSFDRSPGNGFRCARYTSPLAAALTGPVHREFRDYNKEKPGDDELFAAYKSLYAFEPSDLKSTVDATDNSSPYWRVETVSFQTAYGNQRMKAYLFLPKNAPPPYNPVVYFPGQTARFLPSSRNIPLGKNNDSSLLDYVIRSGRAVLYPVYHATYERSLPMADTRLGRREERVRWAQDVHRSIDYLATRSDIDLGQLAYYGFSTGSWLGPIIIATEPRFRLAVWLDGGLLFHPELPESDPINFLPRVKVPVLMVNGGSDFSFPLDTAQIPTFHLLGTPEGDKRHVVLDAAHGVIFFRRNEVVREVLAWFDRYAPVKK